MIELITTDDFRNQFPRFTPVYLPEYVFKTYFNGDIVYYNNVFYQCKVTSTTNLPTVATDWNVINQSPLNYTQDADIINAMQEAKVNFNEGLFDDCETKKLMFLYLTAFYLTLDFRNATNPNGGFGLTQSKSVGSVSESYGIPQWVLNKPQYSIYAQNGYGLKYLNMLIPYLTGNIILAKGATTYD